MILIAWDLPPFCRVCGARGYADNHARHRNRCDGSRGRAAEMTMHDQTRALLPAMLEARDRFMELVDELRPELHRYCGRQT